MERIRVLLAGGPVALPDPDRVREVSSLQDSIKLCCGHCHDHYKYSGEFKALNGSCLPVFRWCDRTMVAE